MHHEEGPPGRSHWDELAEQLGVPTENAAPAGKVKQTEPSIGRRDPDPHEGPQDLDDKPAETLDTPETAANADGGSEDDRPARRRRGRRGGRRHREAREASDSERPRRSRSAGRGDKRPRKTRRSRSEEPPAEDALDREVNLEEVHDERDLEPQAPPTAADETDDEEIEKISDWNVPSWAEIVSGLHRP
jgi:hypothetical protein